MADVPVTQRAYTLRLRGVANDNSWRDRLWRTHEAVNKGAKAFGDWLLTMRGGLSHELVDMKVKTKANERDPNDDEKRDRRILLALSWLSVESKLGAPVDYIIASGKDAAEDRNGKVVAALEKILKSRNLADNEIAEWKNDCSASLSAAIRDDAVWVNRSKAFDDAVRTFGGLTREYAHTLIMSFFGSEDDYLRLPAASGDDESGIGTSSNDGPEFRTLARQWVSTNFGTGQKSDTDIIVKQLNRLVNADLKQFAGQSKDSFIKKLCGLIGIQGKDSDALRSGIGWSTGRKSKGRLAIDSLPDPVTAETILTLQRKFKEEADEKQSKSNTRNVPGWMRCLHQVIEKECGMPFRGDRDHIGEYSVILDHAARRVSLAHTWIKRAEAERRKFEGDAKKISCVPPSAKEWLDAFCEERSGISGAIDGYRIRKRAVDGWKEIVKAWSKPSCKTEEARKNAVGLVQAEMQANDEKFGEAQLFEALAVDKAQCVWHKDGDPANEPDPQPLLDYVAATNAEAKKRRFKVPAYRHPNPLLHPVFCDFGNSRWDIEFDIHEYKKNSKKATTVNIHGLKMGLLDGSNVTETPLQWSSKLLASDLAIKQKADTNLEAVSRASRLGRAAKNITRDAAVSIAGLFEQKDWNGRLQAPREQLEMIARLEKKSPEKAASMRRKIKWLITFSPRLQPQGPWIEYAAKFADDAPAKPFVSRKGEYAVKHKDNDSRKGHAKLILSRLPGLRVLSVDLGHRYAAACAVWETLTNEQVKEACKEAGCEEPSADALYLHLKSKGQNGKDKTTIYRRIGADTLPDGTVHPAPWARLDRQFIIKLQGEEKPARKASLAEIEAFCKMEQELDRKPREDRSVQVDELMSDAVRLVRLGLKRHGDRARIAHYLTADKKVKPGGVEEKLDDNGRKEMLTNSLELWHELFSGGQWTDEWAKAKWDEHIKPLLNGADLPKPISEEETLTSKERKKRKEELCAKLKSVAEKLVKQDNMKLYCLWATRWREDDVNWKKRLRWLRDWILPKGKSADSPAIRNVGGLSLTRIATIKSLYQVQKAYFQRFTPEGRQMKDGKPITAGEGFGQSIRDAMENMREQRVKQLASRIVEAALGVGRIKIPQKGKDPKRPCEQVDAPCHAVVIENLTHYRPEETRTRRENRQLMTWSSSKVKKYLSEACHLHGLHLREVPAGYTSRQDSRTGAPGIRCEDVPVKDFLESPFWKKQIAQAEKKLAESKGDARERFLCDLNAMWKDKPVADWEKAGVVRVPLNGGEVFVSADHLSPAAKGLQADLNAAANIGLRALTDPDWPGKWWYVPCDSKEYKPFKDKVDGSTAIDVSKSLKTIATKDTAEDSSSRKGKKKRAKKSEGNSKEVVNLWRDISSSPLNKGLWEEYAAYQNKVQCRVVKILRKRANLDDKS